MKVLTIAMLCHSVNAAFCLSQGDDSQPTWDDAPDWQIQSAVLGVEKHLENPSMTPEQTHQSWLDEKIAQGWVYGEEKDPENKTHPCIVPYDELDPAQRAKDYLFKAVVTLAKDLPEPAEHFALVDEVKTLRSTLDSFKNTTAANPQIIQHATPVKSNYVSIQYLGNMNEYKDRLYDSGLTFSYGQVRSVPPDLANRFLKHPEFKVIELSDGVATKNSDTQQMSNEDDTAEKLAQAKKEQEEKDKEENFQLDQIDLVNSMNDKPSVAEYARTHFAQEISNKQSLDWMKEKVIGLIKSTGAINT